MRWAVRDDCDTEDDREQHIFNGVAAALGKRQEFPEVDRAEWFTIEAAKEKILKGSSGFSGR